VERQRQFEAAAALRGCRAELAARGGTIITEMTGGAGEIEGGRHYPEGEVYDPHSHAQYFYHRHPGTAPAGLAEEPEHGHFHLFLRGDGIPSGIAPLLLPELAVANAPAAPSSAPSKRGSRDEVCHLVAVALDRRGEPVRLFTTNRWVTGETWYRAEDAVQLLGRFRLQTDQPSAVLNRWLGALVRLFEPDIAALLRRRDEAIREWRWRWRGNVLEDPRLEVTASAAIDLDSRLAAVEQGLPAGSATAARRHRPPRMAEGWGA
jgi:uncharacterized protein DUF6969